MSIIPIGNANPEDTTNFLTIKSVDGTRFSISKDAACKSEVINGMIEVLGDTDEPIPLMHESCTSQYLHKVLLFLDYIHNDQTSTEALKEWIDSKGYTGAQPIWFQQYINVDKDTLFGILLIADYLDIQILINFACFTIANQIKSMSPEDIQRVFSNNN